MKKSLGAWAVAACLAAVVIIQFIPSQPVVLPAELPPAQRAAHRVLAFEGITNFRDLGGYTTSDGKTVRWGRLYRSGDLSEASRSDLQQLPELGLGTVVDFRSGAEKTQAPDQLPEAHTFEVVEIPTLDQGNAAIFEDLKQRIDSGDFEGFDANALMEEANRQFAGEFTPQFRQFFHTLVAAEGSPVLWHCTAGKDRTGFAAAVLLELLGVPRSTILDDYMLSDALSREAHSRDLTLLRLFKGEEAERQIAIMMGVNRPWLEAAFASIDENWGSFDAYLRDGLQLSQADIDSLRNNLLE
ncbi:tyrosine-protein phosphatase [Parahaliea maris]|uniref:tyrosine-protein phosphatase n=1 Tax=Parahaliea maris TaxID=2716870 RepID=UPI00164FDADE|nr:tyrosine-protein phosphatase [Parahaliea maris]